MVGHLSHMIIVPLAGLMPSRWRYRHVDQTPPTAACQILGSFDDATSLDVWVSPGTRTTAVLAAPPHLVFARGSVMPAHHITTLS